MSVRILTGDCREVLKGLPDESVHCVVTSPPYFGLRDYGVAGQIGLEKTPEAFIDEMVAVFREVRRALRCDGTLWLNVGDSYSGSGPSGASYQSKTTLARAGKTKDGKFSVSKRLEPRGLSYAEKKPIPAVGTKAKDLIGVPWMLAFALRADGWWLRQDIIWAKPNPMPESVVDRCTKSHEYVFLISKGPRYFYDADAIAEPIAAASVARLAQDVENQRGSDRVPGKTNGPMKAVGRGDMPNETGLRNARSVWNIATQPFSEAHFATFPTELAERCIKAGCPAGGVVLDPFGGAGTVGLVADRLQRDAILIELNPEYAAMAERRIRGDAPMFAEVNP